MNAWLWIATVLIAALVPLVAVAAWRSVVDGVVALEVGGIVASVALLLLAEGTNREAFADLAVALAVMSFTGALAFLRFLGRVD